METPKMISLWEQWTDAERQKAFEDEMKARRSLEAACRDHEDFIKSLVAQYEQLEAKYLALVAEKESQ
jgi:hypothetical protein